MNKRSRQIFVVGEVISFLQLGGAILSATSLERRIEVPQWWNPSIEPWLCGWRWAEYGGIEDVPVPDRARRALSAGDRVTITCYEVPFFFAPKRLTLVVCRIGLFNVYISSTNPLMSAFWVGFGLLPFLISAIIAIEVAERRRRLPE